MDDDTHPSQAKIRLELERLRTENRRLRGLLGLDGQGHEALLEVVPSVADRFREVATTKTAAAAAILASLLGGHGVHSLLPP